MDATGTSHRSRLPLLFTLMGLLIVGSVISMYWAGAATLSAVRGTADHHAVGDKLERALTTLKDAERGQRGYLLTGEEPYLDPYKAAASSIHEQLKELDQDARAGYLPQAEVDRFRQLTEAKLAELEQTIELRRTQGLEAALTIVRNDSGMHIMDALLQQVRDTTGRKTAESHKQAARAGQLTVFRTLLFALDGAVMLGFMLYLYGRIHREMAERIAAAGEAAHQRLEAERQQDLFAVTLSSIGDAVMVTDIEARVTFINQVAQRLTGWSAAEAYGQPSTKVFNIINETSRELVESPIDKVLRMGVVVGLANHTLLIRKDGSEVPIDDSGAPIRGSDGAVRGVVLVFRDFSEHKNAERLLRQAKEQAEAANAIKDNFLAALSHELRTPLTPVMATLTAWDMSADVPVGLRPDVQMMRRNVELEARLIDDLLELTRIVKGKLAIRIEVVDVHDLLNNVVAICRHDLEAKRLNLATRFDAHRHFTKADAGRLQQVFWNVLKNATKFTPEGGHIDIQTTDDGDGHLQIQVRDDGMGMSAETLGKLFQPFQQGTEEIVRQYGGLGLGMTLSKALLDAQNGEITASSEGEGCGSTFAIGLPAVDAPSPQPAPAPAPETAAHHALRILLVEDHRDTAIVMSRILKRFGHEVTLAHTVASAVETAGKGQFDLLLSDIGLPDGTGIELMARIRESTDMPAIALTGFGMEEDVAKCRQAGFQHHLTKPLNFRELETLLQQIGASRVAKPVGS